MNIELLSENFNWKDDFANPAIDVLHMSKLPYCDRQIIGMALAKLKIMEEQDMYPKELEGTE